MFPTPRSVVRAARAALMSLGVAAIAIGIGPFGELARAVARPVTAIAAAGFAATLLAMTAFPWHRRAEIVRAVVAIGAAVCAVRFALGRGAGMTEGMALIAGAIAAWAPVGLEGLRRDARQRGDVPFEVIAIEDRRRDRRRRPAPVAGATSPTR